MSRKIIFIIGIIPTDFVIDVRLGNQMRNSPIIQYQIYLGVILTFQIQKIHIHILFKSFSMQQLTEYATIRLIIQIFYIGTIK